MANIRISDELELRDLRLEDSELLYAAVDSCRSHLSPWLPWVNNTRSPRDSVNFIEICRKQREANNGFQAGIWWRESLVGCIGFHRIDWANRRTSLGYWIREDAQGFGIMTRACRAMIDHALVQLNLNRIEIHCGIANNKSRAIPERLGFKLEGTAREAEWLGDRFTDHALYAMLKSDWGRMVFKD